MVAGPGLGLLGKPRPGGTLWPACIADALPAVLRVRPAFAAASSVSGLCIPKLRVKTAAMLCWCRAFAAELQQECYINMHKQFPGILEPARRYYMHVMLCSSLLLV